MQERKEHITVKPPAYHFSRAAVFKAWADAAEKYGIGRPDELARLRARSVYELALGFEALAYAMSAQPADEGGPAHALTV